jgi:hypothetical protein
VRDGDARDHQRARDVRGRLPAASALLARTRVHHEVREVSADKAYSSVDNHDMLDSFSVEAFIPFSMRMALVNVLQFTG